MCFITTAEACLTVALLGMQKNGLNPSLAEIDSYAKFELVIPSKYDRPTISSDLPAFKKPIRSLPDMVWDSNDRNRRIDAVTLLMFIVFLLDPMHRKGLT